MKINNKMHIRRKGPGAGKPRHNPEPYRGPLNRIEELKRMRREALAERQKVLTFEIGPVCRVCNYPIGPDWIITRNYIQCPKCKHKYDRSPWSRGQ